MERDFDPDMVCSPEETVDWYFDSLKSHPELHTAIAGGGSTDDQVREDFFRWYNGFSEGSENVPADEVLPLVLEKYHNGFSKS